MEQGNEDGRFRCGSVAMAGRPNVGKSTLLNHLLGSKIAIVTPKPQTTRDRILGILTMDDRQVLFLDAPGIHRSKKALNRRMVSEAFAVLEECDVVLMVTDSRDPESDLRRDEPVIERLSSARVPVVLALNKVDLIAKPALLPLIDAYSKRMDLEAIVPVCARDGDGVGVLLDEVTSLLPEGPAVFPADQISDRPLRFLASEFVREKVMLFTKQEVPYSTAVRIELFEEPDPPAVVRIAAAINVERSSQKAIIIGRRGEMLKRIGTAARVEMEKLLGRKVYLELFVRVEPDWASSDKGLNKLGY